MNEVGRILTIIEIVILLLIIVLTWIYALPILLIRRLHTATNLLTCNVCLVSFLSSVHWIVYNIFFAFYPTILNKSSGSCTIVLYFQTMVNCLVIYALLMITINRYFLVIYPNKRLFRRHTWCLISSIIQWTVSIVIPFPYLILSSEKCVNSDLIPFWVRLYRLLILLIFPSILHGLFNFLIFRKARSSTEHLNALSKSSSSNSNCLNARDARLLKHIIFTHVVFVIGWGPICHLSIIELYVKVSPLVYLSLRLLPPLSLLIDIIDLFLYNYELRRYLKQTILEYFNFIFNTNK